MSEQATTGPWEVLHESDMIYTVGSPYGHGQMHVADARGWGHLTGTGACHYSEDKALEIQAANARLIAAAPDLLAACKDAEHGLSLFIHDPDTAPRVLLLRTAIAKATGR